MSATDTASKAVAAFRTQLAELEERVATLELRPGSPPPSATPAVPAGDPTPDDRFWALDGLRERADERGGVMLVGTVTLPDGSRREWQWAVPATALMGEDWSAAVPGLQALAHPVRLRLVRAVLGGVTASADLGADEGLGTSGQLYHHLRQLVAAGWLRSTGRGQYEVPGERAIPLLAILAAVRR